MYYINLHGKNGETKFKKIGAKRVSLLMQSVLITLFYKLKYSKRIKLKKLFLSLVGSESAYIVSKSVSTIAD